MEKLLGQSGRRYPNVQLISHQVKLVAKQTIGVLEKYGQYPEEAKESIANIKRNLLEQK